MEGKWCCLLLLLVCSNSAVFPNGLLTPLIQSSFRAEHMDIVASRAEGSTDLPKFNEELRRNRYFCFENNSKSLLLHTPWSRTNNNLMQIINAILICHRKSIGILFLDADFWAIYIKLSWSPPVSNCWNIQLYKNGIVPTHRIGAKTVFKGPYPERLSWSFESDTKLDLFHGPPSAEGFQLNRTLFFSKGWVRPLAKDRQVVEDFLRPHMRKRILGIHKRGLENYCEGVAEKEWFMAPWLLPLKNKTHLQTIKEICTLNATSLNRMISESDYDLMLVAWDRQRPEEFETLKRNPKFILLPDWGVLCDMWAIAYASMIIWNAISTASAHIIAWNEHLRMQSRYIPDPSWWGRPCFSGCFDSWGSSFDFENALEKRLGRWSPHTSSLPKYYPPGDSICSGVDKDNTRLLWGSLQSGKRWENSFVYRHEKSPHQMYFDCPGCVPSAQDLVSILKGKHLIYLGDSLSEEFVNILLCHHQRLNITLEYEYYDEDLSKILPSFNLIPRNILTFTVPSTGTRVSHYRMSRVAEVYSNWENHHERMCGPPCYMNRAQLQYLFSTFKPDAWLINLGIHTNYKERANFRRGMEILIEEMQRARGEQTNTKFILVESLPQHFDNADGDGRFETSRQKICQKTFNMTLANWRNEIMHEVNDQFRFPVLYLFDAFWEMWHGHPPGHDCSHYVLTEHVFKAYFTRLYWLLDRLF